MRDVSIKFRIEKDKKRKARILGLPVSSICRAAIDHAIKNRERHGIIELEPISSRVEAVRAFNKIQPMILELFKRHPDLPLKLDRSYDTLEILRDYILEVPDRHFLDYAKFISGNEYAHEIFFEFLKDQDIPLQEVDESCSKLMKELSNS